MVGCWHRMQRLKVTSRRDQDPSLSDPRGNSLAAERCELQRTEIGFMLSGFCIGKVGTALLQRVRVKQAWTLRGLEEVLNDS